MRRPPREHGHRPGAPAVLAASFALGSVPFSGWAARLVGGVDLRHHGIGTVSGTGLYEVSGFAPLAVAGSLEVATGAVGPLLAGPDRRALGAVAAGLAVVGHDWSPLLGGAGGRGISTVLGATAVLAPEGTLVMAAGLGAGRLLRQSAAGCFVALCAMFPVLYRRRGRAGLLTAACLVLPVLAKRVMGNRPPAPRHLAAVLVSRLVLDRDVP